MWYDFAMNPQAVTQVYDHPPSLQEVDLHEVILHRDGPRLTFNAGLTSFPVNPPERWVREGCNQVAIQLDFFSVEQVAISGWVTKMTCNVSVERKGGEAISVLIVSDDGDCRITFRCQFFRIARLVAYATELP